MSTRSTVGSKNLDGSFDSIYVHFDGYPSHHGPILLGNYNSDEEVKELLNLGNLSMLSPKIGRKQDFNQYPREHEDWCLAYGRDRGETGQEMIHSESTKALADLTDQRDSEYVYIWRVKEKKWYVCRDVAEGIWTPLSEVRGD